MIFSQRRCSDTLGLQRNKEKNLHFNFFSQSDCVSSNPSFVFEVLVQEMKQLLQTHNYI